MYALSRLPYRRRHLSTDNSSSTRHVPFNSFLHTSCLCLQAMNLPRRWALSFYVVFIGKILSDSYHKHTQAHILKSQALAYLLSQLSIRIFLAFFCKNRQMDVTACLIRFNSKFIIRPRVT